MIYEYTVSDIAEAAMVPVHTVRDHIQAGELKPDSITDVARYISGYRAIKVAKRRDERGLQGNEVDAWGDPA